MSAPESQRPLTLPALAQMKQRGEKIAVLTAYDAGFARIADAAGVEMVLVGDSLGMVVQGHRHTLAVSVDHMVYHISLVRRGLTRAVLLADLPFASYPDPQTAFRNAARLMSEGGAVAVKLEGAGPMIDSIRYLAERDLPVCAHLGLTPQSVHALGGFGVQGRDEAAAEQLKSDCLAVQEAGAAMLVLECVPATLAQTLTATLRIPTIGIGAGAGCDGQVLVSYDMLGISRGRRPRFTQDFLAGRGSIADAMAAYVAAVKSGEFPSAAQSY